jgi:hypothetical protein
MSLRKELWISVCRSKLSSWIVMQLAKFAHFPLYRLGRMNFKLPRIFIVLNISWITLLGAPLHYVTSHIGLYFADFQWCYFYLIYTPLLRSLGCVTELLVSNLVRRPLEQGSISMQSIMGVLSSFTVHINRLDLELILAEFMLN